MITFINRFYGIVNFEECVPDNSGWKARCMEKTWGFVLSSLFWLGVDILWYNLYGIAVAAAMGEPYGEPSEQSGGQTEDKQMEDRVKCSSRTLTFPFTRIVSAQYR